MGRGTGGIGVRRNYVTMIWSLMLAVPECVLLVHLRDISPITNLYGLLQLTMICTFI